MDAMTDETDTTSAVARVLRAHEWRTESGGVRCRCRALLPTVTEYHDHQAAMLADAGLLRAAKWATGGPVTGKSQIVGLPEGGCEYLVPLEHPQIATQAPAEQPHAPSGGNGTGGGLGERLRALGTGQTRSLRKELREIADEAYRLEHDREGLRLRAELAEAGLAMLRQAKDENKEGA